MQLFSGIERLTILLMAVVEVLLASGFCFLIWRWEMCAVIPAIEREHLFQEILNILRQWPELDRKVFSQAHYEGQSLEAISRSLQLDVKEVSAILIQCDCQLHASLLSFRKSDNAGPSLGAAGTFVPIDWEQHLNSANSLARDEQRFRYIPNSC